MLVRQPTLGARIWRAFQHRRELLMTTDFQGMRVYGAKDDKQTLEPARRSPAQSWKSCTGCLAADSRIVQIDEIATMHLGPQAILMALTLRFRSELSIPALDDAIREITFALQAVEKRVAYFYVRPGRRKAIRARSRT
jgi:hypothetical protein